MNKLVDFLFPFLDHLKSVEYVLQAHEDKPIVLIHQSQENEHEYLHRIPDQFHLQPRKKLLPTRNPP